ncbi:hypothetical protein AB0E10_42990 [Streptomyces sp. NPDC048045]|uniref:hypothetical protein n=1 Tax=Streptomyces sp. NPDC048045 TaxID=3154710 RepID=UPI00343ECA28
MSLAALPHVLTMGSMERMVASADSVGGRGDGMRKTDTAGSSGSSAMSLTGQDSG